MITFESYHFHIYFHENELEQAQMLVSRLVKFDHIEVGRIRETPVGPHPVGSCQITVKNSDFNLMVEWFLVNRKGLSLFVHAVSGDDIKDHTDYVMWIGDSYKLNLDFFKN